MSAAEMIDRDVISPTPQRKIIVGCSEHKGREVELYCDTCEETICLECVVRGSKHHSHEYKRLNEAYDQYKVEMTSSLNSLEEQLKMIMKALEDTKHLYCEIYDQQETIRNNIHQMISKFCMALKVRETDLINQLDKVTQDKLKSLAAQRDQIETTQENLSSYLSNTRKELETSSQLDALMMKSKISQVKELTNTFQQDMLKPKTEADLIFTVLNDFNAECGEIYHKGPPDPSKCIITGLNDTVKVDEKSTFTLQIRNTNNQSCKASMSCDFESEIAGHNGSTQAKEGCQYKTNFKLAIKGRHRVHIKVEGQHIRGSPFPVSVRSPVEKISNSIKTISGVRKPRGVAVSQRGEIVVTEERGHCVRVFSPKGKKLQSFGTRGTGEGQFKYPVGVAIDAEENILVTDSSNHRIQKFTAQGKFLTTVGLKGSGHLQFRNPLGIAVSASNSRAYIVDHNNYRIQILNSDLTYFGAFGQRGSGEGQFSDPQRVACDSTGNVYVVDRGNSSIQVFTAKGEFLRVFGSTLQFISPFGIAIDSSDRVYLSDLCVSVFTPECQVVTSFANITSHSLAVDSNGVVYVCDELNNRIKLY